MALGKVSLNMFWDPSIKGSDFLQASMGKIDKYAKSLHKANILGATKFGTLNNQLKSMDNWLGKIQKKTALISRQPLTMVNAKGATNGLKEQLRTQKAIERSMKQTAFHSRNDAQNRSRSSKIGRANSFVNNKMKIGVGIATGAVMGGVASLNPIRKAIDFETSMADVTKATNASKEQTLKLKKNILSQVDKGSLLTASQIAQIQAGGGRSGVQIKDLSSFTSDIARASVAMDLSTDEAGTKFAKMAERMNLPISKINIMTNAFTHLENNGANSARSMINTTGRLAGIFKELKFSPQNSAAISNYMNTLEVSPELAATSFKILNNRFKKTNSKFGYFSRLQKKGAGELKNIIIDINKTMSKEQIMKTFGAQGANVISKMVGDLKNLDKSLNLVKGNNFMSAVDNEYGVKMSTTGADETMAKNRIEGSSIVIGDKLKNQYISFLNVLSNGISTVTTFYNKNQELINSIGGIALKVAGIAIAFKGIAWVVSPFIKLAKGAMKLKGVLSGLKIASKIPILQKIQLSNAKGLMTRFKSLIGSIARFAKLNPIVIGATLVTSGVMAGLNHMAKNAKPLAERQEQKGIGKSLIVSPVNNTNFDPTKKIGTHLNKGFSLKGQLETQTLDVQSPSLLAKEQMTTAQAQVTHNDMKQVHQTFNNHITVQAPHGNVDVQDLQHKLNAIQRQSKHTEQDTTLTDVAS